MKIRIILIIILTNLSQLSQSQEKYVIDWNINGIPFGEFVRQVESRFNIRFLYEEQWVKNLTLGDYGDKKELDEILKEILTPDSIYFYSKEVPGLIILSKYFAVKQPGETSNDTQIFIPGSDYGNESGDNEKGGHIMSVIGNINDRDKPGTVTLSGYIVNQETREPVAGATVYFPGIAAGTISNSFGFYRINLPRGNYSARFTFIGMKEITIDMNIYGSGELNVEMKSVLVPIKEAVISAEKNITLQRYETGVEKLNVTSLKLMTTSLGESDIVKSALLIPGVNSVGEGSAGFNVRGGSADQNLILLYGAPLYNSSHFFGFFSAINSDIIRDVTLFKGGIPAKYGGRLSSVLDIVPRDGNRKEFAGNAGISPLTAHFVFEGPIIRDTLFYLITARTTYSNWVLRLMENPGLRNSNAYFNDLNFRLAYDINRNNKIDLSTYYSYDEFSLNSDTTYKYRNNIISIRWRHNFSSHFLSSITLNNSFYRYDISSLRVSRESFNLDHRINSTGARADFNWFRGKNEFNFGAEILRYNVVPGDYMPVGDSSLVIPNSVQRQRANETALYFDDKFILNEFLSFNAGIRLSTYFALGPQTVMIYDPSAERSSSSVTDTLSYHGGGVYKTYGGPELRLSANFRLTEFSSVKLNYNHTIQYIHLLSNTTSISPTDTWKLSDYHMKPQSGDQFAAGYYTVLNRNKIEFSAEVYYKKMENMVDFKGGTNLIMNRFIERDLINVYGKSFGLELLLKKPEGRIRWSIGYTFSRVFLRSKGSVNEELINSGNWFPASFDKPHDLVFSINCVYSRRVSLAANYTFSSGRPVTYPLSAYKIGNIVINHYSERNQYRIPDYSRLDFSIRLDGTLKSKKIAHPYWIFSVYNVLGRSNVYSAFFRNVNNTVRGYYLSIFARPIPSVSFNFDF